MEKVPTRRPIVGSRNNKILNNFYVEILHKLTNFLRKFGLKIFMLGGQLHGPVANKIWLDLIAQKQKQSATIEEN